MSYFFDSYAVIEIIKGNPNYEKFKDVVFITNTLHLAEIFYSLLREINEEIATQIIKKLNFEFIEITTEITIQAAIMKYKNKELDLSYADCIGYLSALKNNFKFVTGDKEFKNFENVEFVEK